jgi:heme/copper-type cytochrome/quinol oxidase subunit 2
VNLYFTFALIVAVIGVAVAGRFLYLAWSDVHIGRNRRKQPDRRQTSFNVPMERRRRDRRI